MPIDNTVMVTIRHSDNALSASEATTASINRWDATGALWPLKPVAPGERIMATNPYTRANHRDLGESRRNRRQDCGVDRDENR